jgi:hypothetical protein
MHCGPISNQGWKNMKSLKNIVFPKTKNEKSFGKTSKIIKSHQKSSKIMPNYDHFIPS